MLREIKQKRYNKHLILIRLARRWKPSDTKGSFELWPIDLIIFLIGTHIREKKNIGVMFIGQKLKALLLIEDLMVFVRRTTVLMVVINGSHARFECSRLWTRSPVRSNKKTLYLIRASKETLKEGHIRQMISKYRLNLHKMD